MSVWSSLRSDRDRARGFTLLEVIVAIGIVAILISIAIPSLGGARQRSRVVAQAANLRSVAHVVELYADAWDDTYPMADRLPFTYPPELAPDHPDDPLWGRQWYEAVFDAGLLDRETAFDARSFNIDNASYSLTLLFRPETFAYGSVPPYEDRVVEPIRRSDVAYPGRKGSMHALTVDGSPLGEPWTQYWCCVADPPGGVAFADASVDIISRSALPEPRHPPFGTSRIGGRVRATWDGVHGTDR